MADVKISELTAGVSLTGVETVPVVQSATTVKTSVQDIANLAPVASVAGRTGTVTLTSTDVGISSTQITNWDTAYGWGDHGVVGYLTTVPAEYLTQTEADARYLQTFTESDPVYAASSWYTTTNNASQWNTAYGWGDHSTAGYSTFDGAYSSLTGTPTIPTDLTDLGISDGTTGQVLTTDGAGNFSFATPESGGGGITTGKAIAMAIVFGG